MQCIAHIGIDQAISNVNWTIRSPCTSPWWMEVPIVACAAATYYQIVLVVLGLNAHTYLPMTTVTPNQGQPTVIRSIALISRNTHYVPVSRRYTFSHFNSIKINL